MQKLFNIVLGLAVIGLALAVTTLALERDAGPPDETRIRALIADALENAPAPGEPLDVAAMEEVIEGYLLSNPGILQDVSAALESQLQAERAETARVALAGFASELYEDPANIVLGNPEGDVTLVELFDYNCTYCRQVVADVLELIEDDPGLRVILKEFPILSADSVEAARIGVLVNQSEIDYARFHAALMTGRGTVDQAAALDAAQSLGLDRAALESQMQDAEVTGAIERTYAIAQGLDITGTPTFIIGNEIIPGAVGKDALTARIANMRACGQTACPAENG